MKNPDLCLSSYDFNLPAEFIADRPVAGRHNSKLLVYNAKTQEVTHTSFKEIANFLPSDSQIVMNQSKVFPCRLLGKKSSGGKAEIFLLSLIHNEHIYPAMIGSNGKKNIGDKFYCADLEVTITGKDESGSFLIRFNKDENELLNILEEQAQIPIPPYIRDGIADEKDKKDYQTVYAKDYGSVAAPTAGLHFTEEVFKSLEDKNIKRNFVTLHVGAGTFKPVSSEDILEHKMHKEYFDIDSKNLESINAKTKRFAVGTTTLRVLESCYKDGNIGLPSDKEKPYSTEIFLYPGKKVQSIDGIITNFHLPKSTLLMLVSSLIGREKTLELYEIAKANNYRFFSYGDAMLILR